MVKILLNFIIDRI